MRQTLRLRPHERDRFIDDSCEGDAALAGALRRRLAQLESATIGASPRSEGPSPSDGGEQRLGSYSLQEVLGEGGMGVVHLAEQESPRRTVAVKVIRPGLVTSRMLDRFEHEARVLAHLQHPGIAQIFEAGCADSGSGPQPFFAMEYVDGVPVTAHSGRTVRERVELMIKICDAVQHAHQKGVIHRDLKPANILITDDDQPKVLDFGVSRAAELDPDGAAHTEAGQLVGTLAYMSPEQITGKASDLDTRSDVYALGVLLYELLGGRLPHDVEHTSFLDAARMIEEQAPRNLGLVDRTLRGDLATIAAKALEKDPMRRYQTAADLASDLQRWLDQEPILARPPSRTYATRMFVRRNRAFVAALVLATIVLIGGVTGTVWQAFRATAGWEHARDEAETALAVSDFLGNMLEAVDPGRALGREITVREVLDEASASVASSFADRPHVELALRGTLSDAYRRLNLLAEAERHALARVSLVEAELGADHRNTHNARRGLANIYWEQGRFDESEPITRQAIDDLERLFGADDMDVVMARNELALLLQSMGRLEDAERELARCLEHSMRARGPDHEDSLTLAHNHASMLKDLGQYPQSEAAFRSTLDRRTRLHGREHPLTVYTLNGLATVLQRQGRHRDAADLLGEALEIRERVLGGSHASTITSRVNLASCLSALGDFTEAESLLRDSLDGYRAALGPEHPKTLVTMGNLAYVVEDLGDDREAESLYREILLLQSRASGPGSTETWSTRNNLAMLLVRRGELDEARSLFVDLLDLCEAMLPEDHVFTAIYRNNFGTCLLALGELDAAADALLASYRVLSASLGPRHERTTRAIERLVQLYESRGDEENIERYRQLLD